MNARLRAFVVAATTLVTATPSWAAVGETHWWCWLHADQTRAVCTVVASAPDSSASADPGAPAHGGAAMTSREWVREVREQPSRLIGQNVFVPLHTVPFDDASVGRLVQSVLCGAAAACDARYHPDLGQLVAQAPEFFADLSDPLLEARR
jgi:hypothetical protein